MPAPQRFIGFAPVLFLLAAALPAQGEPLATGGTGWSVGLAKILGTTFAAGTGITVVVAPSVGSGGGIQAVNEGTFGIAFSARQPTDEEKGEGTVFHPLCRTPFVLAVSMAVKGDLSYSRADVLNIFERKITHWPDGTQIALVLRPANETGSQMLVENFDGIGPVLEHAREARGAIVVHTDQDAMDVGEKSTGALLPVTLAAIRSEGRLLRPLTIDGVEPTPETLADGRYPFAVTLLTVLGPAPTAEAVDFLKFIESPTGRSILRDNGCLPIDH